MRTIPEHYPKKQGRPQGTRTLDLEGGESSLQYNYIYLKGEYDKVEALLEKTQNELIAKVTELIIEMQQVKLHLASMSDADVGEADTEVE